MITLEPQDFAKTSKRPGQKLQDFLLELEQPSRQVLIDALANPNIATNRIHTQLRLKLAAVGLRPVAKATVYLWRENSAMWLEELEK